MTGPKGRLQSPLAINGLINEIYLIKVSRGAAFSRRKTCSPRSDPNKPANTQSFFKQTAEVLRNIVNEQAYLNFRWAHKQSCRKDSVPAL